jgi:hypothetical protein
MRKGLPIDGRWVWPIPHRRPCDERSCTLVSAEVAPLERARRPAATGASELRAAPPVSAEIGFYGEETRGCQTERTSARRG